MAFISRTRLVQVADMVNSVQTVITPVVVRTSTQVVQTVLEAIALVPPGSRPPVEDAWKYSLLWEVQSHLLMTLRGVVPDTTRLVFDVDFWETQASQVAGDPPLRRNTFTHEFTTKRLGGAGPEILAAIDDYLLRAEFGGYPADGRDPRIVTTTDPAHDPLALMTRSAITSKDGVYRTTPSSWRGA